METQTSCIGTMDYSNSLTRKKCFDIINVLRQHGASLPEGTISGKECQKQYYFQLHLNNNTFTSDSSLPVAFIQEKALRLESIS